MALYQLFLVVLTASAAPFERRQASAGVPDFAIQHAPLVYLHSADAYRPSGICNQLANTRPERNFTVVEGGPSPLTLDNLHDLNDFDGEDVYLTSLDDVESDPAWLLGVAPDSDGKTGDEVTSAIIVNDHGGGLVDVFYMYFYAFNYGGDYFGLNIGNHVGDWEHNMIRFRDGVPQAMWYSQHAEGQAFEYKVLEKEGTRVSDTPFANDTDRMQAYAVQPIAYSAKGTHAVYATAGPHDHTIPNIDLPIGPLLDETDRGVLWDPTLSAYYYHYDAEANHFEAYDASSPVNWLYFTGHWGDEQYPASDPRQELALGSKRLAKYGNGPTGPIDKQLNRTSVCPENGHLCIVRKLLTS